MCTQLCKTFAEWNLFHEFKKLTVLRSPPKSDSFAGTLPGIIRNLSQGLCRADRAKKAV